MADLLEERVALEAAGNSSDVKRVEKSKKAGASHLSHLKRLNRIEGQVRGIAKMVEEGRYCIDILTQIKAIKSALSSVELNIIDAHLNHCVHNVVQAKKVDETQEIVDEIRELLKASMK